MWRTKDYNGNEQTWYEAELIEKIKEICQMYKRYYVAQEILKLMQENEK